MPESRVVLIGSCFSGPQYYAQLNWTPTDVHLRHPDGGKDSRHNDGSTFLTGPGSARDREQRVPTSAITREVLNYLELPVGAPQPLRGAIRPNDIVLPVDSATSRPSLAVEIVNNSLLAPTLADWQAASGISSVLTVVPKGLDQSLVVAIARR